MFAYLHGFASGPRSTKGQRLKRAFEADGRPFFTPDLNAPSFAELSFAAMLERVDALDAAHRPERWRFVGSSLGGWVAARWAELNPGRVARLLLLCPAFDVAERWPTILPPGAMERWASQGALPLQDGAGVLTPVHYRFYEESKGVVAFPEVPCPTRIVHGTRDGRVPIDGSRRYAATRPHVELFEVDDEHSLADSHPVILEHARGWLAR